ncbi:hypothetical protein L1049_018163 [Liquidambar formosana]|uniref:Uncharacterized protein n=1 Tax=Liquidambar formosana TaxID=63359 RepID=A0AAP0NNB2_LIQFO
MIPCPPEFRLDSASVNPFNLSSDSHQISTNWNISIFLRNSFAEWTSISYEALQVMVLYEERIISAGSIMVGDLQGTEKKKRKAMVVQGSLGATSMHVDDWLRKAILKERSAYGVVDFTVTVEATVRIRLGLGLLGHTGRVWVPCYHVKMELPSNSTLGTMVGGPRKCQALVDFKSLGPF